MRTDVNDYYEFINEEMSALANRRLRDAIHDIVVELKPKEIIDVEELSDTLSSNFRINISPFFLDKFLDDFMRSKKGGKVDTFFTRGDAKWLGIRDNKGKKELRNNLLYLKPSLSKHKRRLFQEEEEQKLENAYKEGMKELDFTEDIIKKTLILQHPDDSKEMMKSIYSDVIKDKRYHNTYENCWKLMMQIGKYQNLDRIRGYWRYAPESIKKEFASSKRLNLEPTKIENKKTNKPSTNSSTDSKVEQSSKIPINTEENMKYLEYKIKSKKWSEFINVVGLTKLIDIIEGLKITSKHNDFLDFRLKTDELMFILTKFYRVNRIDVINYFKKVKLDKYFLDWEDNNRRPKINDF